MEASIEGAPPMGEQPDPTQPEPTPEPAAPTSEPAPSADDELRTRLAAAATAFVSEVEAVIAAGIQPFEAIQLVQQTLQTLGTGNTQPPVPVAESVYVDPAAQAAALGGAASVETPPPDEPTTPA